MKKVLILMGSESDRHIADKSIEVLERYSIPYKMEVASAHRQPAKVKELVHYAEADVIICIAGLSAALPGVVASMTAKPVIGVPVDVKLGGMDALLSMAQMPSGVPVATVGIDNGKNAAYLALRILGIKYPEILSSRPEPTVSEYNNSESETPSVMPDFMTSTTPEDPVTFGETPSKPEEKKRPRGDWWV